MDTLSSKKILLQTPTTRYRGSKRRILPWIFENVNRLNFETVLDGFGGTGSVSYLFKMMGKKVTFNDILQSNYQVGLSIIENNKFVLTKKDNDFLIRRNGYYYPTFIRDTFKDIYYLNEENEWLDTIIYNIDMLSELYNGKILKIKRALAYNALFQACLCKRPYNLFHRKNLYMRTANVERSFYNKKTWEKPFNEVFIQFSQELSNKVFSNKKDNTATSENILDIEDSRFDLVYLDPPYISARDHQNPLDYFDYYHFLEGIVDYSRWASQIDYSKKNKSLIKKDQRWNRTNAELNLDKIFNKYSESIIVISYSEPGYPSVEKIEDLLSRYKKRIEVHKKQFTYTLNRSKRNGEKMHEVLIIGY